MENLRKNTIEELEAMILDKKLETEKLTQDILKEKEKDLSKLKKIRKEIARMRTVIRGKQEEINA